MREKFISELDLIVKNYDMSKFRNKSIMITGASGMIASYLVETFLRANDILELNSKIYAVVRNIEAAEDRFKIYKNNEQFEILLLDITNKLNLDFKTDFIIHAASNANPESFDNDPIGTIKANVNGTMNLLDYAHSCNTTKFVYLSSTEVYGENTSNLPMFTEKDMGVVYPTLPRSCYTEGKRIAENICVNYHKQYSVSTIIARIGYAYGPTFTVNDNRVIPQFINKALNNENIILKSKGDLVRSYIYVPDVVSAIIFLMNNGVSAEVYNISNKDSNVSIKEIAETIAELSDILVVNDVSDDNDSKGYSPFSKGVIDSTKLEDLGWEALYPLREGVRNIINIRSDLNII